MTTSTSESIISGGLSMAAVWLNCEVLVSRKSDEYIVSFPDLPGTVEPPAFFVQPEIVEIYAPGEATRSGLARGRVKVILLESSPNDADTIVIEIPGEPMSYGPKLVVPRSLVA